MLSPRQPRLLLWRGTLVLAAWLLICAVISLVLNAAIYMLASVLVSAAAERIGLLLASLGFIAAVNLLVAVAVTFVRTAMQALLIVRLYRQACRGASIVLVPLGENTPALRIRAQWTRLRKAPLAIAVLALAIAATMFEVLKQ